MLLSECLDIRWISVGYITYIRPLNERGEHSYEEEAAKFFKCVSVGSAITCVKCLEENTILLLWLPPYQCGWYFCVFRSVSHKVTLSGIYAIFGRLNSLEKIRKIPIVCNSVKSTDSVSKHNKFICNLQKFKKS